MIVVGVLIAYPLSIRPAAVAENRGYVTADRGHDLCSDNLAWKEVGHCGTCLELVGRPLGIAEVSIPEPSRKPQPLEALALSGVS